MKDRITLLIKAKNYTSAQFAEEIGVQKSGISHIISGRNNPSLDFVQKILTRFPEVSMEWLILGKGPMFSSDVPRQPKMETTLFPLSGAEKTEPDLFSPEISDSQEAEEIPVFPARMNTTVPKKEEEIPAPLQAGAVSPDLNEKIPAADAMQMAGIEKKIEKILFIYADRTFAEYKPES